MNYYWTSDYLQNIPSFIVADFNKLSLTDWLRKQPWKRPQSAPFKDSPKYVIYMTQRSKEQIHLWLKNGFSFLK